MSSFVVGWINELLSWKAFIPLGRLTYMAYLVHPIVMLHYYMSRQELVYFTNYEVVSVFHCRIYPKYSDTLTPYYACPKI